MRDDRDLLNDILERIQLTEEFIVPGKDTFFESRMMQEAVIRNLEIIGEASRALTDDLREKHTEIPWKQIAAFRNFVIHVYWQIKLERIWEIIENDLPPLKSQIEAILDDLRDSDTEDQSNDESKNPSR